jgi:hypothetical protein
MIGEDECTKLPRWTVASCYGIPTGVLWTVEDPDIQYDPGWEAFEDAASILAELEDEGRRPLPMPWSQEVADRVSQLWRALVSSSTAEDRLVPDELLRDPSLWCSAPIPPSCD